MKAFINEDFLLQTDAARELYHGFAKGEPIYDYHCHVPPQQIADNHQFGDLAEMWLGGDHYKWRAMRANGVDERFCTGDGAPREKFDAWVATVPQALGNPLYHWSHLELVRYFGISEMIGPATADTIWARRTRSCRRFACTTSWPPTASPSSARPTTPPIRWTSTRGSGNPGLTTRVYPAFRPDKALGVANPKAFNPWVERLGRSGADTGAFVR